MKYSKDVEQISVIREKKSGRWDAINPEYAARMRNQNLFKTGIDIAKYTASIMREDMDAYDKDSSAYTQSLGCWHGFIAQQKITSIYNQSATFPRRFNLFSN